MKVLVIGTGFGEYGVAPVYRKVGFDVEVVSPRDQAKVDALIVSDVDLVSIHSPPFMHHDHVMKAFDAGHAVLCDKPFGADIGQSRAMHARAKASGLLNFCNFELRTKDTRAAIKEVADSGKIGKPLHLSWTFFSNGFRSGAHGWVHDAETGGGWINAYATHLVDFTRWLFDSEVAQAGGMVRTEYKHRLDRDGVERTATAEDAYSAWFVMENGCTAAQDSAYAAAVPLPSRVTLLGSEGAVELIGDTKLTIRRAPNLDGLSAAERIKRGLFPSDGDEVIEFEMAKGEVHEPALTPWFEKVKQSLETGVQVTPSFDDGLAVAEALHLFRSNLVRA